MDGKLFAQKLKGLRKERQETQEQLAVDLFTSKQYISKLEKGNIPSVDFLELIANHYNINIIYLLQGDFCLNALEKYCKQTTEIPENNQYLSFQEKQQLLDAARTIEDSALKEKEKNIKAAQQLELARLRQMQERNSFIYHSNLSNRQLKKWRWLNFGLSFIGFGLIMIVFLFEYNPILGFFGFLFYFSYLLKFHDMPIKAFYHEMVLANLKQCQFKYWQGRYVINPKRLHSSYFKIFIMNTAGFFILLVSLFSWLLLVTCLLLVAIMITTNLIVIKINKSFTNCRYYTGKIQL